MFLFPLMKKRSAADPLAALRGRVWSTMFSQGADAQKLYPTATGDQTTGVRGSGTGSDGADPTWENYGASFDGGDYFSSVPYAGVTDFIDTGGNWTLHARAKANSGNLCLFNSVPAASWVSNTGCYFLWYQPGGALYAVNDWNRYSTYFVSYSLDNNWHTHSIVNDSTDLKWYVDASLVATFTVWTNQRAANTSNTAEVKIGSVFGDTFYSASGSRMRALAFCNVVHDATELSAANTLLAALPNAA